MSAGACRVRVSDAGWQARVRFASGAGTTEVSRLMTQPTFQQGGIDWDKYKKWAGGTALAGLLVGIVVGLNPIGTIVVAFGVVLVGNGALVVPRWRTAQDVELLSIGSLAPGQGAVEVSGTAYADRDTVVAPYTDTECLAYTFSVEDYQRVSRRHGHTYRWQGRYGEANSRAFLVEDNTGTAWVDPTSAEFDLAIEERIEVEAGERPPAPLRRILEQQTKLDVVNDHENRRFTEYRLDDGEDVHVAGVVDAPPASDDPDAAPVDVTIADGEATPLFSISDGDVRDVSGTLKERAMGGIGVGITLVLVGSLLAVYI